MKIGAALCVLLLSVIAVHAAEIATADRKSGFEFMGRDTQAMQTDDTSNPGMLNVLDGGALWSGRRARTRRRAHLVMAMPASA